MSITTTHPTNHSVPTILLTLNRRDTARPHAFPRAVEPTVDRHEPGHVDLADRLAEEPERWDGLS